MRDFYNILQYSLIGGSDTVSEDEEEEEKMKTRYVTVEESKLRLLLSRQCPSSGCQHPCLVDQTTRGGG